jgi:hypothetical protein
MVWPILELSGRSQCQGYCSGNRSGYYYSSWLDVHSIMLQSYFSGLAFGQDRSVMMLEGLHASAYHVRSTFIFEYLQKSCPSRTWLKTIYQSTRRDALMIPLLNACVEKLKLQHMKKMFIDAVSNNVDGFKRLGMSLRKTSPNVLLICCEGFREWAGYRDVWRDIWGKISANRDMRPWNWAWPRNKRTVFVLIQWL